MQRKTKKAWSKVCFWSAVTLLLAMITWENVQRLENNIYANYEKAVDYGRVREDKLQIEPVVAAIFYADKNVHGNDISMYLNHSANYHKKNVKMVVAPRLLTKDTIDVVEKLYSEIAKHNQIKNIAIVYNRENHAEKHSAMLKKVMQPENISFFELDTAVLGIENKIERYLNQNGGLVVILNDLNMENPDFLTEEAIYWAQKYHYNVNVFDVIDTQIAEALEKDYKTLFALHNNQDLPLLTRQKQNLEQYERRYGVLLWHWFMLNISRYEQNLPPMWPLKSEETYRLYDRGTLYAEAGAFGKVVDNTGIVVALVRMAQRFVHKNIEADNARLYLLTDKEEILPQVADLQEDDGVYMVFGNYKALILPKERLADWNKTVEFLRSRARVPADADETKFKYYKFKVVEINNEN